ncbi:MAG: hypothetical protein ACRDD8_06260 [Bacteroidales bacterium]
MKRFKDGVEIDTWSSIRLMCDTLGLDRRAVIRVINQEPRFKSVKGYTFKIKDGSQ